MNSTDVVNIQNAKNVIGLLSTFLGAVIMLFIVTGTVRAFTGGDSFLLEFMEGHTYGSLIAIIMIFVSMLLFYLSDRIMDV